MKILIIHNIRSGRKSQTKLVERLKIKLIEKNEIEYFEVFNDDSMRKVFPHISRNDLIIISGGDGTVSFFSSFLIESDKPLLIIPAGSGNDFANSLGFQSNYQKIIDAIEQFKTTNISTMIVNENKRALTIACFGFEARVNRLANKLPRFLGSFKYTAATLFALLGKHYEALKIENNLFTETSEYSLAIVANTPSFGGGLMISNKATATDDKLYLILVNKVNKLKLIYLFILLLRKKHFSRDEFREYEVKQLTVDKTKGILQSQADGERLADGLINVRIDPFSMKVLNFE